MSFSALNSMSIIYVLKLIARLAYCKAFLALFWFINQAFFIFFVVIKRFTNPELLLK